VPKPVITAIFPDKEKGVFLVINISFRCGLKPSAQMTYCNSASNLIEITFLFSVYLYDGAKSVGIGDDIH
jgi:hypothetical protein